MHTRRTEGFHERLLEAGVALFAEMGYHGTGVKDIVERAGVPKGSFYSYFDSKEAFGAAILRHYTDEQAAEGKGMSSKRFHPIRYWRFAASMSASLLTTRIVKTAAAVW